MMNRVLTIEYFNINLQKLNLHGQKLHAIG